ncbi:hypothetical protein CBS101457_005460 [Exobasidium rhododendri]|nr:hypothetical protein CBS101457_005460 [Exobasidium rhododendri]
MARIEEIRASLYGQRASLRVPDDLYDDTSVRSPSFATAKSSIVEPSAGCIECVSSLSFAGEAAKKYAVGTQIPGLPFQTKNAWAGLMPISAGPVAPSLYFFLWGKDAATSGEEVVIWINGGPGCSALGGMTQELGPWLYESVNEEPYPNSYSWTKAATMVFVEQPVGTGFTTGVVTNTNEDQVAAQFATFLDNFYETFPELAGKKLYITGESYAGTYIPYIMNYQYTHGNKHNLQGGIIIDGVITDVATQMDLVVYDFAVQNAKTIGLTTSDLALIKNDSDACGLTGYAERNLKYPPIGKLPDYDRDGCGTWNTFYALALKRNPTYNVYRITTPDPAPTSPLGQPNGGTAQNDYKTFFDNAALQSYINASHKKWNQCNVVFVNGDQSLPPDASPTYSKNILTNIVEKSAAGMIIMQGQEDSLIITNGTSISLQNLTWHGTQGFSEPPTQALIDVDGKATGTYVTERGLTYAIVNNSGHMVSLLRGKHDRSRYESTLRNGH